MASAATKLKAINWLQMYGITRMLQQTPTQSVQYCERAPDAAMEAFDQLAAREGLYYAGFQNRQLLMGQTIEQLVQVIPVVGQLGGFLFGWMNDIAEAYVSTKEWGCHKVCRSSRDSSGNLIDARNLIPVCPPPGVGGQGGMGWITSELHDGLVVWGRGATGSDDSLGRMFGVTAWMEPRCYGDRAANARNDWSRWNLMHNRMPGLVLTKGNWKEPWKTPGDNWFWRSFVVNRILKWFRDAIDCDVLMCVADQIRQIIRVSWAEAALEMGVDTQGLAWDGVPAGTSIGVVNAIADISGATTRRMWSRWYATLYYMQMDLWELALSLPPDTVVGLANELGETDFSAVFGEMAESGFLTDQHMLNPGIIKQPFNGYLATRLVSWEGAKRLIPAMHAELTGHVRQWAVDPSRFTGVSRVDSEPVLHPGVGRLLLPANRPESSLPDGAGSSGKSAGTSAPVKVAAGAGVAALAILALRKFLV
jgi:hypothetical protein